MAHVNFQVRIKILSAPEGMNTSIPLEKWGLRVNHMTYIPDCYREDLVTEELRSLKCAKSLLEKEDISLQFLSEDVSFVEMNICNLYEYTENPDVDFFSKIIHLPYTYMGKEITLVTKEGGARVLGYP